MTKDLMPLSDVTTIRPIAGGAVLAVVEGVKSAVLVKTSDSRVHPCNWLVQVTINDLCSSTCGCEGAHGEILAEAGREGLVRECGAPSLEFPNGWACVAGHTHYTYGGTSHTEYFTDDEVRAARDARVPLPANARLMDGRALR